MDIVFVCINILTCIIYVGTSPMVWRNMNKGAHTVIVRANCVSNGVTVSTKKENSILLLISSTTLYDSAPSYFKL